MKRLCIFYNQSNKWVGRKIEWIVCKDCQKKINRGLAIDARLILPDTESGDIPGYDY